MTPAEAWDVWVGCQSVEDFVADESNVAQVVADYVEAMGSDDSEAEKAHAVVLLLAHIAEVPA